MVTGRPVDESRAVPGHGAPALLFNAKSTHMREAGNFFGRRTYASPFAFSASRAIQIVTTTAMIVTMTA